MSYKRIRARLLYAFSVLLVISTILTGCGQDVRPQEQVDSTERDISSEEEITSGQTQSGDEAAEETAPEMNRILWRRIRLLRRRRARNYRQRT